MTVAPVRLASLPIGALACALVAARAPDAAAGPDAVAVARAWWDAAAHDRGAPVDFFVDATIEIKPTCAALHRGRAHEHAQQRRLRACVREVDVELGDQQLAWSVIGDLPEARGLKPKKGDRLAQGHVTLSGIDLYIVIASDAGQVVRRVWITESYFE